MQKVRGDRRVEVDYLCDFIVSLAFWVSYLINELPWHLCRLYSSELIIGTFQAMTRKC